MPFLEALVVKVLDASGMWEINRREEPKDVPFGSLEQFLGGATVRRNLPESAASMGFPVVTIHKTRAALGMNLSV